jgi:dipeptidyl aminopeptidase/acylaminoacyl peptidase
LATLMVGNFGALRLSPDGQKVAVSEYDIRNGGGTIWVQDLRSTVRTRFIFGGGMNLSPTWSPDGSQAACCREMIGSPLGRMTERKSRDFPAFSMVSGLPAFGWARRPSQKIECVFSASPETVRRKPRDWNHHN